MALDTPDSMVHVERTPVQKLGSQILGTYTAEEIECSAEDYAYQIWDIPDDGYFYALNTCSIAVMDLMLFDAFIDFSDARDPYDWHCAKYSKPEGLGEMIINSMGVHAFSYPASVRFCIYNYRGIDVLWNVYCYYFKYKLE